MIAIFDGSSHRDLTDGVELRGIDVNCEGVHRLCLELFDHFEEKTTWCFIGELGNFEATIKGGEVEGNKFYVRGSKEDTRKYDIWYSVKGQFYKERKNRPYLAAKRLIQIIDALRVFGISNENKG